MVLKRIISCLAIISVVFLMSCYDVAYDKDDGAAATGNWWDGLSQAEIIQWMGVKAEPVTSTKSETSTDEVELEVSWECPIDSSEWIVDYSETGEENDYTTLNTKYVGEVPTSKSDPFAGLTVEICRATIDTQAYSYTYYKYWFKCKIKVSDINFITYFKVKLKDLNDSSKFNESIVSFMVYPQNRTLRVTITGNDAVAKSSLTGHWRKTCGLRDVFEIFNEVKDPKISPQTMNISLAALSPVIFWIDSDFRYKNISNLSFIRHASNSSYCDVKKITTAASPVTIGTDTYEIEATLNYRFEDLPKELKRFEPTGKLDYNDVVFTVDIMRKNP